MTIYVCHVNMISLPPLQRRKMRGAHGARAPLASQNGLAPPLTGAQNGKKWKKLITPVVFIH